MPTLFHSLMLVRSPWCRAWLLGTGLLLIGGCHEADTAATTAPLQEVVVYEVASAPQALTTTLPGRASAHLIAEIRPQVGGIVQKRLFTEGDTVKAGQALYQIDPLPYQAALAQAQATVSSARATLRAAGLKAKRDAQLVQIDAISAESNESAQAALLEARASLESALAAQRSAKINLDYTRIASPIDGRTATSSVTPGALVTAEQTTALTTVQQLDPIYVDFTQPSATVLRLKRELAAGTLARGERQDATRVSLELEDGSTYAHAGTLTFNGVSVDTSTGSVTFRAVVPNPEGLLMPGMYLKAQVQEGVQNDAILVPQQAVSRDERGAATALVVVDGKVQLRPLTLARAVGDRWWVSQGLAEGDRVIVQGVQKVRVGQVVQVRDSAATATDASAPTASGSE